MLVRGVTFCTTSRIQYVTKWALEMALFDFVAEKSSLFSLASTLNAELSQQSWQTDNKKWSKICPVTQKAFISQSFICFQTLTKSKCCYKSYSSTITDWPKLCANNKCCGVCALGSRVCCSLLYLNLSDFVCCISAKAFSGSAFQFKVLWEDTVTFVLYQIIIFPLTSVNNAGKYITSRFLMKHISGMVCVCSFMLKLNWLKSL